MKNYIANTQNVLLNNPILFNASNCNCTGCSKIYHQDGSGVFVLSGRNCDNSSAGNEYQVTFNGNIALPEGATVTPIAIAIAVNGEPRLTSRAIFTPAAAEEFGNVTSTAIIKVPKCCCFSLSVDSVPATTDTTVTPAPIIEVQNANFTVTRIA
jgi:hypothetical protein